MSLLRYLQQRHQHISWERVVSGMGLLSLHEFLCLYRRVAVPQWLDEEMRNGDAAAAIASAALSGTLRTSTGTWVSPANCAARQRLSPAMIS